MDGQLMLELKQKKVIATVLTVRTNQTFNMNHQKAADEYAEQVLMEQQLGNPELHTLLSNAVLYGVKLAGKDYLKGYGEGLKAAEGARRSLLSESDLQAAQAAQKETDD